MDLEAKQLQYLECCKAKPATFEHYKGVILSLLLREDFEEAVKIASVLSGYSEVYNGEKFWWRLMAQLNRHGLFTTICRAGLRARRPANMYDGKSRERLEAWRAQDRHYHAIGMCHAENEKKRKE